MGMGAKVTAAVIAGLIVGGPALLVGAYSSPLPVAGHRAPGVVTVSPKPAPRCPAKSG